MEPNMSRRPLQLNRDSPNRRVGAGAAAAVASGVLMLAAHHLSPHKKRIRQRHRRSSLDSVMSHAVSDTSTTHVDPQTSTGACSQGRCRSISVRAGRRVAATPGAVTIPSDGVRDTRRVCSRSTARKLCRVWVRLMRMGHTRGAMSRRGDGFRRGGRV